ncbi:MAG: hypothetical protein ACRDRD_14400 [Pseudonocardiaceae bacterium]
MRRLARPPATPTTLGPVHDQSVDLAGRQADAPLRQGREQVGGGEHAPGGHDLPQMPLRRPALLAETV